jgi:type VI secretion system Hcp family effector
VIPEEEEPMMKPRALSALLLAAGLVLAAPERAAIKSHLQIEGVQGLFEVEDYSFDMEQTLQIGSQSSGAGAGKITFNPFSITRKVDVPSPSLFNACANGKHFPSVTLHVRKAGGSQEFYVVKLTDVFLTSYRTSGAGPGKTESATVNFARAELEHAPGAVALAPTPVPPPKITGATAAVSFTGFAVTVTITSTGACRDAFVDYGDGSIAEGHTLTGTSTTLAAHTYPTAGAKTIKVGGRDAPYWPPDPKKVPPQKGANPCTGWAPEVHVTPRSAAVAPANALQVRP